MKITQVRNATIIVEYNNTKFLIDPWLMPKDFMPGFEAAINFEIRQPRVDLPFEIEKIIDANAVIITHIHPDHWDDFAEKDLNKDTKIFVQSDCDKDYILSKGFKNVEIISTEGTEFNNTTLYKTSTQHGKKEILKPICEKIGMPYDAMGVVFKSKNEKTLYLAGDSIWCSEINEAINKYIPDIIIVNACAATVLNGEKIIMGIEDIKEVMKYAPEAIIIASHMDTVSHLSITRKDLKEFKQENNIKNLLIPDDGSTIEINNK